MLLVADAFWPEWRGTGNLLASYGHIGLKWSVDPISPSRWTVSTLDRPKWTLGAVQPFKWSVAGASTKWLLGGVTVPNADTPLSALSLEYVRVPVFATANGVAVNPTADAVKMAFLQGVSTQPTVNDWKAASWDAPGTGKFFAQCLVGPGGTTTLTAGIWYVWIQITDNPEVPVRQVGVLQVT